MMLKSKWGVLILLLVSLMLTGLAFGCGPADEEPVANGEPVEEDVEIYIGTGPTGGTFHTLGVLFAEIINAETNYRAHAEPTDAAVDNIRRMDRGELDLGFTYTANPYWAIRGEEVFEEDGEMDINNLISGHTSPWTLLVRADSDIYSWGDLEGERIYGVPPGGLIGWEIIDMSLEYHGLSRDDLAEIPAVTNLPDAVELIAAGEYDGIVWPYATRGVPAFLDLAATTDVRFVGMEDGQREELLERLEWFDHVTVPAGRQEGQDEDYTTITEVLDIMVRPDLDEEVVYNVTKALGENLHRVTEVMEAGEEWTLEQATFSREVLPYHPGAIRYYEEEGVW